MTDPDPTRALIQERLLRDRQVAQVLNVSVRQAWKLVSIGELPAPLKIGGSTRWRTSDIHRRIAGAQAGEADHVP
jgi:predicted DNA-binding transcriptional regulator AlpA